MKIKNASYITHLGNIFRPLSYKWMVLLMVVQKV